MKLNDSPEVSLFKAGSKVKCWNTMANGSGTEYSLGQTILGNFENLTLYAIWEDAPTLTITGTHNLTKIRVYETATKYHDLTSFTNVRVYPGCDVMFFHGNNGAWESAPYTASKQKYEQYKLYETELGNSETMFISVLDLDACITKGLAASVTMSKSGTKDIFSSSSSGWITGLYDIPSRMGMDANIRLYMPAGISKITKIVTYDKYGYPHSFVSTAAIASSGPSTVTTKRIYASKGYKITLFHSASRTWAYRYMPAGTSSVASMEQVTLGKGETVSFIANQDEWSSTDAELRIQSYDGENTGGLYPNYAETIFFTASDISVHEKSRVWLGP